MRPKIAGLALSLALTVACGGGSTTGPTSVPSSFLVGRWTGTVTVLRDGRPSTTSPTTWTFSDPIGGGVFTTAMTLDDPWLDITATLSTGLVGSTFQSDGQFRSPRGCMGGLSSIGTANPRRIEATFHGYDCATVGDAGVFTGQVVLTK